MAEEIKCCMADEYDGWCEEEEWNVRLLDDGKIYCIFHAPTSKKLQFGNNYFNVCMHKKINNDAGSDKESNFTGANLSNIHIITYNLELLDDINFSKVEFEGGFSLLKNNGENTIISGNVSFANAKFGSNVNMDKTEFEGNIQLEGVVFDKEVSFKEAVFAGEVSFLEADFKAGLICNGAKFNDVNFRKCKFTKDAHMSNVSFLGDTVLDEAVFFRELHCNNSIFNGVLSAEGAKFNKISRITNAHIKNNLNFKNANFGGEIHFNSSIFEHLASFDFSVFNGGTNFTSTTFKNGASFNGTKWKHGCNFTGSEFTEKVSFTGAEISGANFAETTFIGYAMFIDVKFSGESTYEGCVFSGGEKYIVEFDDSSFEGTVNFRNSYATVKMSCKNVLFLSDVLFDNMRIDKDISFDGVEFHSSVRMFYLPSKDVKQYLRDVLILDKLTFKNCTYESFAFAGTDLDKIDFLNCNWESLRIENRMFYDESLLISGSAKGDELMDSMVKVEALNRQMKRKSIDEMNWPFASIWHIREKEVMLKKAKLNKNGSLMDCLNLIGLWLYKSLSHYNESPVRASMIFLLFLLFLMLCAPFGEILGVFGGGLCSFILDSSGFMLSKLFNTLEFLPFVKTSQVDWDNVSIFQRAAAIFFQIIITIQIGLLGMSVRNKLRR